jgi:hypothetical protein
VADLLADIETEPYSLSVETAIFLFDLSKDVEQLRFIFLFDSLSGVFNIYLNKLFSLLINNISSQLNNTPILRKLECIG